MLLQQEIALLGNIWVLLLALKSRLCLGEKPLTPLGKRCPCSHPDLAHREANRTWRPEMCLEEIGPRLEQDQKKCEPEEEGR